MNTPRGAREIVAFLVAHDTSAEHAADAFDIPLRHVVAALEDAVKHPAHRKIEEDAVEHQQCVGRESREPPRNTHMLRHELAMVPRVAPGQQMFSEPLVVSLRYALTNDQAQAILSLSPANFQRFSSGLREAVKHALAESVERFS